MSGRVAAAPPVAAVSVEEATVVWLWLLAKSRPGSIAIAAPVGVPLALAWAGRRAATWVPSSDLATW